MFLTCFMGSAGAGCLLDSSDECAAGEARICSGGDCVCGESCIVGADSCPTGLICAEYAYDPGEGVCVEEAWVIAHGGSDPGTDPGTGGCGECPTGEICVTDFGCTATCSDGSECSSGCCVPLSGTSQMACGPSSYCSTDDPGGDPDSMCIDRSSCLRVAEWLEDSDYCRATGLGEVTLLPVLENTCAVDIDCKVCAETGGALSDCETGWIYAGDSIGGWATDWSWCDAEGIRWACVEIIDGYPQRECLESWP